MLCFVRMRGSRWVPWEASRWKRCGMRLMNSILATSAAPSCTSFTCVGLFCSLTWTPTTNWWAIFVGCKAMAYLNHAAQLLGFALALLSPCLLTTLVCTDYSAGQGAVSEILGECDRNERAHLQQFHAYYPGLPRACTSLTWYSTLLRYQIVLNTRLCSLKRLCALYKYLGEMHLYHECVIEQVMSKFGLKSLVKTDKAVERSWICVNNWNQTATSPQVLSL